VNPAAVILDFDGVVVDTERLYIPIWDQVARDHGRPLPMSAIARTPGKPNRVIVQELFPDLPPDVRRAILDEVNTRGRAQIAAQVRTVPGVERFLGERRGRCRIALATNSSRNYVRDLTARVGLTDVFDPVVCGDGQFRAKPEPDIYLEMLRCLALPAERCVVIEDSLVGVSAARAAGLRVIALAGTYRADELAELTDLVAADWDQVSRLLEGTGA
jgi:HAD superfamily hydrolase (TIGR01509 family)